MSVKRMREMALKKNKQENYMVQKIGGCDRRR
jgi:hypothetical protein